MDLTSVGLLRAELLEFLQDIYDVSEELPSVYWLREIVANPPRRIGGDKEASIITGVSHYGGGKVTVRRTVVPHSGWASDEGIEFAKVIKSLHRFTRKQPTPD